MFELMYRQLIGSTILVIVQPTKYTEKHENKSIKQIKKQIFYNLILDDDQNLLESLI
jgi:hypothetical protein